MAERHINTMERGKEKRRETHEATFTENLTSKYRPVSWRKVWEGV